MFSSFVLFVLFFDLLNCKWVHESTNAKVLNLEKNPLSNGYLVYHIHIPKSIFNSLLFCL